jgi:hypothetical protein
MLFTKYPNNHLNGVFQDSQIRLNLEAKQSRYLPRAPNNLAD